MMSKLILKKKYKSTNMQSVTNARNTLMSTSQLLVLHANTFVHMLSCENMIKENNGDGSRSMNDKTTHKDIRVIQDDAIDAHDYAAEAEDDEREALEYGGENEHVRNVKKYTKKARMFATRAAMALVNAIAACDHCGHDVSTYAEIAHISKHKADRCAEVVANALYSIKNITP